MPTFSEAIAFLHKILNYPLFPIGKEVTITLASIIVFFLVLLGFMVAARIITKILFNKLLAKINVDEALRYTLTRMTNYILLVIGAIVAFQFIGIDLSGIVVILGFLSVGIGFGLQNLTSNFISGIILLFERPIKVGDRVTVGDTEGDVEEINIRSTTVRTLNNVSIIVPNTEFISSSVINWSHGDPKVRIDVNVGVSYASDLDTVLSCLREVAEETPNTLSDPKPDVLFRSFGDSAWEMQVRVWVTDPKIHPKVRSAVNSAIVRKFRENGIEIPFPQRDLHVRSPLPIPFDSSNGNKRGSVT